VASREDIGRARRAAARARGRRGWRRAAAGESRGQEKGRRAEYARAQAGRPRARRAACGALRAARVARPMLRLHVGQAGGQIGAALAGLTGAPSADGHGAVFVDSEPKVVAPLAAAAGAARIAWLPASAVVYDHNGRGNNWAWGHAAVASRLGPPAPGSAAGAGAGARASAAGGARKTLLERAMEAVRVHVRGRGGARVRARARAAPARPAHPTPRPPPAV